MKFGPVDFGLIQNKYRATVEYENTRTLKSVKETRVDLAGDWRVPVYITLERGAFFEKKKWLFYVKYDVACIDDDTPVLSMEYVTRTPQFVEKWVEGGFTDKGNDFAREILSLPHPLRKISKRGYLRAFVNPQLSEIAGVYSDTTFFYLKTPNIEHSVVAARDSRRILHLFTKREGHYTYFRSWEGDIELVLPTKWDIEEGGKFIPFNAWKREWDEPEVGWKDDWFDWAKPLQERSQESTFLFGHVLNRERIGDFEVWTFWTSKKSADFRLTFSKGAPLLLETNKGKFLVSSDGAGLLCTRSGRKFKVHTPDMVPVLNNTGLKLNRRPLLPGIYFGKPLKHEIKAKVDSNTLEFGVSEDSHFKVLASIYFEEGSYSRYLGRDRQFMEVGGASVKGITLYAPGMAELKSAAKIKDGTIDVAVPELFQYHGVVVSDVRVTLDRGALRYSLFTPIDKLDIYVVYPRPLFDEVKKYLERAEIPYSVSTILIDERELSGIAEFFVDDTEVSL